VTTYGEVEGATKVPIGPEGEWIGRVLGEIFRACDDAAVPPLCALVVRKHERWNGNKHGMPGPGYFEAEGLSPNNAGRRRDTGWDWWASDVPPSSFDRDVSRWQLRDMIQEHQDSVWAYQSGPPDLDGL
jgi:hypothetical protein